MAAIEITISGVLYDKLARTGRPVVLIGEATLTGLGVGGGPIYPPDGGTQPPVPPLGIWGGAHEPFPTPPIYLPPNLTPPVPPDPGVGKPPPPEGGWGWHPEYGWGYFPMGGGKPQPPGAEAAKKR